LTAAAAFEIDHIVHAVGLPTRDVVTWGETMPLVFVHGVNTRMSENYQRGVEARDALFRRFLLEAVVAAPQQAAIISPYWGDDVAKFAWKLASVPMPEESLEALGGGMDPELTLLAANAAVIAPEQVEPDSVLLETARRSLVDAVNLIWAAAAEHTEGSQAELTDLAARAVAYADAYEDDKPAWLYDEVGNDEEFVDRLQVEVESYSAGAGPEIAAGDAQDWEALGGIGEVWKRIHQGADKIRQAAVNVMGKKAYTAVRHALVPNVGTFLGDIFIYLSKRGTPDAPGPIVKVVEKGIDEARAALGGDDDKLIIVGHSLGGVVAYDVLTYFRPDVHADVFVTVGSQVALFEELKLFGISDTAVPAEGRPLVPRPGNVDAWVNVFDYNDVLSYRTATVFDDVEDYPYATGEALHAHGAYFTQPIFHERLTARVREAVGP
jgi:hypothetical protein